ncbi:MAG: sigma 54-interacting transcriptional regulator [Deltaproteobacteria bacterium]|nr:sigma 54-interacting transcriptional regulator [Deltaproteobacteria bacterium]
MDSRPIVVIGFLGSTLDAGHGAKRWSRWRPTVAMCQHDDLVIARIELLHHRVHTSLAQSVMEDIRSVSPETEVRAHVLEIDDAWDLEQVYGALHDFAKSYPFRPTREDYLVHITTGTHIAQISSFLLTEARYMPARLLQTSPPTAADPRRKQGSPGTYRIIDLDLSKYDRIAGRFQREQEEGLTFLKAGIDTKNRAFNEMMEQIERVAIHSKDPILLTGPTGAGKSKLARRIFELKRARRQVEGAFVDVNCATLRGDSAMSALFGHSKGAFTGAIQARRGHLRQADKGLLFLDEIGELGLDEQAMLLRAIEEKVFFPVGSDQEVASEFMLIAGTNRDLIAAVKAGQFRDDLLARINLWTYCLPGLAERPEDIEPNLAFELEACRRSLGRNITMTKEARLRFLEFAQSADAAWSGNFRDLNGAVRRMATLCTADRISAKDVDEELRRLKASWAGGKPPRGAPSHVPPGSDRIRRYLGDSADSLDRFDRVQLEEVLAICEGSSSLAEAGKTLFAESRRQKQNPNDSDRIRKYLARFGLTWQDFRAGAVRGQPGPARRS